MKAIQLHGHNMVGLTCKGLKWWARLNICHGHCACYWSVIVYEVIKTYNPVLTDCLHQMYITILCETVLYKSVFPIRLIVTNYQDSLTLIATYINLSGFKLIPEMQLQYNNDKVLDLNIFWASLKDVQKISWK